jgi:serine acetyltransferase
VAPPAAGGAPRDQAREDGDEIEDKTITGPAGSTTLGLLRADHAAHFDDGLTATPRRLVLDAARDRPFRVAALVRLQAGGPRPLWRLWRRLLLTHGVDIGYDAVIGPGLHLPSPVGVVVGRRSRLGASVTLCERTTATPTRMTWREADAGPGLRIGDGVRLLPGAGVFGDDITIEVDAIVAPNAVVACDHPAVGASQARAVTPTPAPAVRRRGLLSLIRSDWRRLREEGPAGGVLGLPFQATVLVRLATSTHRRRSRFGRAALSTLHHCHIDREVAIGPGLRLPMPVAITLEAGVRIGAGVTLGNHVSLRSDRSLDGEGAAPQVEDGTVVGAGSVAVGVATLTGDVAPGTVLGALDRPSASSAQGTLIGAAPTALGR